MTTISSSDNTESSFYDEMGLQEFDSLVKSLETNLDIISNTSVSKTDKSRSLLKYDEEQVSKLIACPACALAVTAKDSRLFVSDRVYHEKCFSCHTCDSKFGATVPYIEKMDNESGENSKFYCEQCYDRHFGVKCATCNEAILNGNVLYVLRKAFHPEHFTCTTCCKPFYNGSGASVEYFEKDDYPYCQECYVAADMVK